MIAPLVNKNPDLLQLLQGQYMKTVKNLLDQNRLVPCLVDSGVVSMIEVCSNIVV
jgi:hypothetical protein